MSKIQSKLLNNETLLIETKPSFIKLIINSKYTWGALLFFVASTILKIKFNLPLWIILGALLICLLSLLPTLLIYYSTNYYITNKRIIRQTDLIAKDYDYTLLESVIDVNVDVTLLDKLIGTGTVKFSNSNVIEFVTIPDVKDPDSIVKAVLNSK